MMYLEVISSDASRFVIGTKSQGHIAVIKPNRERTLEVINFKRIISDWQNTSIYLKTDNFTTLVMTRKCRNQTSLQEFAEIYKNRKIQF